MLKRASLLLVILLTLTLLAACAEGPAKPKALVDLVPEGANLVFSLRADRLIKDPEIKAFYLDLARDMGAEPEFLEVDKFLKQARDEFGIDPYALAEVVFFMDVSSISMGTSPRIGVIAKGAFDQAKLLAAIKSRFSADVQLVSTEYKGQLIYGTKKPDEPQFAFLGKETAIIGTEQAVRDMVDVYKGEKGHLAGKLYDAYQGVGEALVRGAFSLPPSIKEGLAQRVKGAPIDVSFMLDVDVIGLSLDKKADVLSLKTILHYPSTAAAAKAGAGLQSGLSMLKGLARLSGEPALVTLGNALPDKAKVSIGASRVTLTFDITTSEVRDLLKAFVARQGK